MFTVPEEQLKKERSPSAATDITVLAQVQSPYQKIEITRHPVFGNQLIIDDDLQISESDAAYGSAMVAPLLQLSSIRNVARSEERRVGKERSTQGARNDYKEEQ